MTTGRRLMWLWVGWWAAAIVVAVNWVREVSDVPRSALSTGAGWVCGVLAAAFFIMAWVRTFRAWGRGYETEPSPTQVIRAGVHWFCGAGMALATMVLFTTGNGTALWNTGFQVLFVELLVNDQGFKRWLDRPYFRLTRDGRDGQEASDGNGAP